MALVADGTLGPLLESTAISGLLALCASALPFAMARRARPA
jgi:hypothetical protein